MPMLFPGTRGRAQLDELARASEGIADVPLARRATQIARQQDQAATEEAVIKWINAAGAKVRESTISSRCCAEATFPRSRAIRRGAKVVNDDQRVAMGRMHAPSLRP